MRSDGVAATFGGVRRKLLWGLIVLLSALVVISGGYHAYMLYADGEVDQMNAEGNAQYQRIMQTVPPQSQP